MALTPAWATTNLERHESPANTRNLELTLRGMANSYRERPRPPACTILRDAIF